MYVSKEKHFWKEQKWFIKLMRLDGAMFENDGPTLS